MSLVTCHISFAAVTIVDTFDQGGFSMSTPGNSNPVDEAVTLPLAQRRTAAFGLYGTSVFQMSSIVDSNSGKLSFFSSGLSNSIFPLSLQLVYRATLRTQSIVGCTDFILGFSELSGVGTLYVEMGSSDGPFGYKRVDLNKLGDVYFPVADVRLNG